MRYQSSVSIIIIHVIVCTVFHDSPIAFNIARAYVLTARCSMLIRIKMWNVWLIVVILLLFESAFWAAGRQTATAAMEILSRIGYKIKRKQYVHVNKFKSSKTHTTRAREKKSMVDAHRVALQIISIVFVAQITTASREERQWTIYVFNHPWMQ